MDETSDARERGRRIEEALARLLFDPYAHEAAGEEIDARLPLRDRDRAELEEAARAVRRMVLERTHRGSGGLTSWYPATLAAWRAGHPADHTLDELLGRFCASRSCAAWRELPAGPPGLSLEEALYRFFDENDIGDPAVREEELLGAVVRGLAITPRARLAWPRQVRAAPGGCFAVSRCLVLHAALDGRYHRGPVTPLIAALLEDQSADVVAVRFGLSIDEVDRVIAALRAMRLRAAAQVPRGASQGSALV
jgi:hypothetical protein